MTARSGAGGWGRRSSVRAGMVYGVARSDDYRFAWSSLGVIERLQAIEDD